MESNIYANTSAGTKFMYNPADLEWSCTNTFGARDWGQLNSSFSSKYQWG